MPAPANSALVADYRFEIPEINGAAQQILDSSGIGNHAASIGSVQSTASGKICRGAVVGNNSSSTVAGVQTPVAPNASEGSIILSYYPRTRWQNDITSTLFDAARASSKAFQLVKIGRGQLSFSVTSANNATTTFTPDLDIEYSKPEVARIAVTWKYTGSSLTLRLDLFDTKNYVDGVSVSQVSTNSSSGIHSTISTLLIGDSLGFNVFPNGSLQSADGTIDEVQIHNTALTYAETTSIMQRKRTCKIAKYEFEDAGYSGAAAELVDTGGGVGGPFNGKAIGSPLPTVESSHPAISGNQGTCKYARFPREASASGAFSVPSFPANTAPFAKTTIAFWMNPNDDSLGVNGWANTYAATIIGFSDSPYEGSAAIFLGGGSLYFTSYNNDRMLTNVSSLSPGWHHVVAVISNWDFAANKIYIDGTERVLTSNSSYPPFSRAGVGPDIYLGADPKSTSYRFSGSMDQISVFNGELSSSEITALYSETKPCASAGPHHFELRHATGSCLTCQPATLKVVACGNADCSARYTAGATGQLGAGGSGVVVQWPGGSQFTLPAGQSEVDVAIHVTTPGSVTLTVSSSVPAATSSSVCAWGGGNCSFSAVDSGFAVSVPNHYAEDEQLATIAAIRKDDASNRCVPAFASVSKSVKLTCSYLNPSTGTQAARVAGAALNSAASAQSPCDGVGAMAALAFDAQGVATASVKYADTGALGITADYSGDTDDAGLRLTGTATTIVAPKRFLISSITAGPIRSGGSFSATVSAVNSLNTVTPNFGKEDVPAQAEISFVRREPAGVGAVDGQFSGGGLTFSNGSASKTDLAWYEVGKGDLNVALLSGGYLGSGLGPTGSTGTSGAVGPFIPDHFDLAATPACGEFSYAGQPTLFRATAKASDGRTTINYDGTASTSPNYAKQGTFAVASTAPAGAISGGTLAASSFTAGVAEQSVNYSYSVKKTGPTGLILRLSDSTGVSSQGGLEPTVNLRSGRMRLANAFGAAMKSLQMPVVMEYWHGQSWILNSADNCTTVGASSVALSNGRNATGAASTASTQALAVSIVGGSGKLTLSPPNPTGSTLSIDVAVNLGATQQDRSCHTSHPSTVPAVKAWLRSGGGCSTTEDNDPGARATFGIYAPETRKVVHLRDIY